MPGPLDGIRVLDLTAVLFGPYCTMLLGDMGADVVKIESGSPGDSMRRTGPSRHDGMAAFYLLSNRNKRSVALDLKQESGRAALWRLVDTADVFIHSIRPQSIHRLGFGHEAVLERNPRIVYAGLHGFGERGAYAGRAAYDDVVQAAAGMSSLMGELVGEPLYFPTVVADKASGLTAVYAVLGALVARERTGKGQYVEVPMFEAMVEFVLREHQYGAVFDPPLSPPGYPRILTRARRPYPTRDGHVCILPYTDAHWRTFCGVMGRPELADDPRFESLNQRTANIEAMYDTVAAEMVTRTTAEWVEALLAADVPVMGLNRLDDLPDDPHLRSIGFFRQVEHPTEGRLTVTEPPVRFADTPSGYRRHAPNFGEHSITVLRESGFADSEIESLVADGVVVDGSRPPS